MAVCRLTIVSFDYKSECKYGTYLAYFVAFYLHSILKDFIIHWYDVLCTVQTCKMPSPNTYTYGF